MNIISKYQRVFEASAGLKSQVFPVQVHDTRRGGEGARAGGLHSGGRLPLPHRGAQMPR